MLAAALVAATGLAAVTMGSVLSPPDQPPAAASTVQPPISLTAIADTFVSQQEPTRNFGSAGYLDTYGGTQSTCTVTPDRPSGFTAPAYGLLKFDLSSIPAGAVVTGARVRLVSRAGYAQNGDQNHHLIRLADTTWNESTVTWDTRPADGAAPVGSGGTWSTATTSSGADIRTTSVALGNASAFRAGCNQDPDASTTAGLRVLEFPTNGADSAMGATEAQRNLVAAINDARRGGVLSLEVFNPTDSSVSGQAYWARYLTRESPDPSLRPRLELRFEQAVVTRAVPGPFDSGLVGVQISGLPSQQYGLVFETGSTCENGILGGEFPGGTAQLTTNASGTAAGQFTLSELGRFVAVRLEDPDNASARFATSACVPLQADNDAWTRAQLIPLTGSPTLTGSATGYLDTPGGSRWYRFAVQPGSRVRVDLTNLPVDLDLALFRDIAQTFNQLTDTKDLLKLSAEFAPSVFSPSVFSPSVFSPSVFSPDAFAPSVFSPDVFSPSVFSPSVFSPSVFSPSVFSPSVFSPSVFSPSVFSPSVFSPSVFSPSVFSPEGVSPSVFSPETFASAQTRSLVTASATEGTADEFVVANTWNATGFFYVRVTGRNGASSASAPFSVGVTREDIAACAGVDAVAPTPIAAAATGRSTIVLMDSSRMAGGGAGSVLRTRLDAFAARSEVRGVVVDLAGDARVQALNAQADGRKGCPYAKNLVAGAIKDIVTAYRASNPQLAYVVIVGPDGVIPFFRYPDDSLLGPESDYVPPVGSDTASEASLRLNYVLGQDEYGATDTLALGTGTLPIPDLAVAGSSRPPPRRRRCSTPTWRRRAAWSPRRRARSSPATTSSRTPPTRCATTSPPAWVGPPGQAWPSTR